MSHINYYVQTAPQNDNIPQFYLSTEIALLKKIFIQVQLNNFGRKGGTTHRRCITLSRRISACNVT